MTIIGGDATEAKETDDVPSIIITAATDNRLSGVVLP
jgi:hypothetical protein